MRGRAKKSYPSATGKLLCVLLNPGDGELLTYVTSGQGEHCQKKTKKTRFSFLWYLNDLKGFQPANHGWTFHPALQESRLTHVVVPKYSLAHWKTHLDSILLQLPHFWNRNWRKKKKEKKTVLDCTEVASEGRSNAWLGMLPLAWERHQYYVTTQKIISRTVCQ